MAEMTEELKAEIVADCIVARQKTYCHYTDLAKYLIRLMRALDNYRERDEMGRFKKKD